MRRTRYLEELPELFFAMRQLIRGKVQHAHRPNHWMRFETLRYIGAGETTMQDLSRYLRVTAPSATSLVGGLVREGLVRRLRSGRDMRLVRLALTKRGRRRLDQYVADSTAVMAETFSEIDTRKLAALVEILRAIGRRERRVTKR